MAKSKKTFEELMQELEIILDKISAEETPLNESIDLYAKAADLVAQCNNTILQAQVRVEEINLSFKELGEA